MSLFTKHFAKGVVYSIWFALVTVFYFVPLQFHHTISIGIIPFLVLDGEGFQPGAPVWGGYGVLFYPLCFVITILLWITTLFVIHRCLRYVDSKAYLS